MLWYILRITMSYAFPVFYRRFQMKHAERIREKGPMIIAMNHPNAFMDPMTFSWMLFYPRTRYMARGDAFKKGMAARALQSMGIVPIYRLRDGGYENVKKNLDSFNVAYDLFDKDQKIMVFAEGLCVQERRLRPIQKGTAKMAFAYLDRGGPDNLKIVPAGLNYSTPSKFRGDVFIEAGEPIVVKDYYEEYKQRPAQTIIKLTALIEERMKVLVPGITHKENDKLIEQLLPMLKEEKLEQWQDAANDLSSHQKYTVEIIERVNALTEKDPLRMELFRKEVNDYCTRLNELEIEDQTVRLAALGKTKLNPFSFLLFLTGLPLYSIGKILNYPVYALAKKIAARTSKTVEFRASVHFGSWALLTQLFFALELGILWYLFNSFYVLLGYCVLKIGSGIFALKFRNFKKKILSSWLLRNTKRRRSSLYEDLLQTRRKIVAFLNENQ